MVITIGSSATTYPLLKCNGAQVVVGNLWIRYRYSTVFSTKVAGTGAFRLLGKVFCCEEPAPRRCNCDGIRGAHNEQIHQNEAHDLQKPPERTRRQPPGLRRPDMRDGYSGTESRFRDRDGREHYNDGRYAPMNRGGEYGGEPMGRGGCGCPRSAYMEPYSHYPMTPSVLPVYQREDWQTREGYRPINRIGFSVLPHWSFMPATPKSGLRTRMLCPINWRLITHMW